MAKKEKKECYDCLYIQTVILDFIEGAGNDVRPDIICKCGKKYESGDNEYSRGHGTVTRSNEKLNETIARNCAMWLDSGNTDALLVTVSERSGIFIHHIKNATDLHTTVRNAANALRQILIHAKRNKEN